jgi:hypothetical protein
MEGSFSGPHLQRQTPDVTIDQSRILDLKGGPMDGLFLDGITIPEPRFATWI